MYLEHKNEVLNILKKKYKFLKVQNKDLFANQAVLNRQIEAQEIRENLLSRKYKKLKVKMHNLIDEFQRHRSGLKNGSTGQNLAGFGFHVAEEEESQIQVVNLDISDKVS